MHTEERPTWSSSSGQSLRGRGEAARTVEGGGNEESRPPIVPAKLPPHSRAAAAQRLNDRPEKPTRGFYYEVAHRQSNPAGWRTKRHLKRKNLRISNLRYAAVDRMGTKWTLLPMAIGALLILVVLSTVLVTITAAMNATHQRYGEDVTTLTDILPKDSLKMYDSKGILIYQAADQGLQSSVPLSKISKHLINAEIAIEDQNYWENPGYDITGIARAVLDDLAHGRVVSGASTITQQLIKNAIVGDQVTAVRKLQELILAPEVTKQYSKEQILSMYLNTIYYGEQAYGANAAAYIYFGLKDTPTKSAAEQLNIAQAAMLAGIPSSPVARDPFLHPKAALGRMQEVLKQMYLQGYITRQEMAQAISDAQKPGFLKKSFIQNTKAPHFVNYTLRELAKELHVKPSDLSRSGLIVNTTLDLKLQDQVLKIAQKHIAKMAAKHNMSNAAVVIIDPHTGAIRTMLGNIDPQDKRYGAFDVASQGFRQPGSSFKPFIYATAFAQGISPGETVVDAPLTVQMCCGLPSYSPKNYDLGYHGLITYRYALQNSFNIPAVKLLMRTGVDEALNVAKVMGLDNYQGIPNYTMVLGTLSVHLVDITSAYGTFTTGGIRVPHHAIATVKDTEGHLIFQPKTGGKRVISRETAFMVSDVMSDNVARTFEFGKCSSLYLYSNTQQQCYAGNPGLIRPAAVKTGTSTDFRDNWTVGYTTDYVIGVWAGNNDNTPMHDVTGVDGAAPIWHDSMLLVEQGLPVKGFTQPPGVVKKTVSYPGKTTTDWYLVKKP
jgi:membrane peptidoglycan carboxypeptidase